MKPVLLQEAFWEFSDAIGYYEEKQKGLGKKLKKEFDLFFRWISENPTAPRMRKGGYRRVNLHVFPYYIAYIIRQETLWIIAFAHVSRKPEYWIDRKPD